MEEHQEPVIKVAKELTTAEIRAEKRNIFLKCMAEGKAKINTSVNIIDERIDSNKTPTNPLVQLNKDPEIIWFSEVDYNDKGKLANDFPAWYFRTDELKENIRVLETEIEDGIYTGVRRRDAVKRLSQYKDRLDKIENGKPKLEGTTKDKLARSMKDLSERIKDSMFSYDSHWKMTADPHIVAERMTEPCIEIKDEMVNSFVSQRGMKVKNGKICQNDANIIWKVMNKALDEPSDVNVLRPTRAHGITI